MKNKIKVTQVFGDIEVSHTIPVNAWVSLKTIVDTNNKTVFSNARWKDKNHEQ